MTTKSLRSTHVVALLFLLALASTIFLTPFSGVNAQKQEDQVEQQKPQSRARKLEGTWRVQVTIRVCQTGAEIRTFPSLVTFVRGGTMTEASSGASPALRGPGHGIWEHTGGHTFRAVFEAFTFNSAGLWSGTQKVTQTVEVGHGGDVFNANASNEIFDANGTLLVLGCSTAIGHRLD